jgi:hypothetical protein
MLERGVFLGWMLQLWRKASGGDYSCHTISPKASSSAMKVVRPGHESVAERSFCTQSHKAVGKGQVKFPRHGSQWKRLNALELAFRRDRVARH